MKAIIKSMVANLHAEANANSELIDEGLYGMVVEIVEQRDDWCYVRTPYRYEGFCKSIELIVDSAKATEWQEEANYIISQGFADVLLGPKIQNAKLITLVRGSIVRVLPNEELDQEWAMIELATGEVGYTRKQWISEKVEQNVLTEENFREQVVQTALSYLTTPYRWGGKSPLGIDCSGLCSMAYMLNGVIIYRDAKIADGFPIKEISIEQIQKGDLLYFPGHIAMYMGDGLYVHSSLGGNEVSINSLNKEHIHYRDDLATTITAVGSLFPAK
ncbi:C40 family peptidase [Ureibacillus aquaedulcis]|uniref:SH3 domain-containing C40 family peptidase n=1 Tax=Ureibacillus aquaedulcis TaxID=3058421 RepID=A0ABT8GSW5_9BACL|nr:SH3 domain-containing C40 family peptidase [Ureibacillus sp. BA0131]MDN4494511.1 SH3 domain-containing C40 family peptidase [Ureibacillus sp. BA0131]